MAQLDTPQPAGVPNGVAPHRSATSATSGRPTSSAAGPGTAVTVGSDAAGTLPQTWFRVEPGVAEAARRMVRDTLLGQGVDEEAVADAVLLLSELVGNIESHTASTYVGLHTAVRADEITVTVTESSTSRVSEYGLDVEAMPPPEATSGRGLPIVDAMALRWGISRGQQLTSTWFTLKRSHARPVSERSDPSALDSLQAALRRSQLLLRITEALAQTGEPAAIGAVVTGLMRTYIDAAFTGIALPEADNRNLLHYLSTDPLPEASAARWTVFALDRKSPVGAAFIDARPYFHQSVDEADAEFPGIAAHMATAGTAAMAHLPLIAGGQPLGTLCVAWDFEQQLDANLRALLLIVAGYTAQALYRPGAVG